jgi:hypothetical protein
MTNAIAPDATGLWRRQILIQADGRRDTTTQVLWLQTHHLFADLRIPADRPDLRSARGLADYDAAGRLGLAAMKGFAGTFEIAGDLCRWNREIDFQPADGPPDEARFRIDGDILIETGLHEAYEEVWQRETPSDAVHAGFRLSADASGQKGILVVVGDHFIAAVDRRPPLPPAVSLAALLAVPGGIERPDDLLGMPIAYGRIGRAGGSPWQIELSTFPWLEGHSLIAGGLSFDPVRGILDMNGFYGTWRWQLTDTNHRGELAAMLAATG